MHLDFHRIRFHFRARGPLYLPPGTAANRVRGGLGRILKTACPTVCTDSGRCPIGRNCLYGKLFEPATAAEGPSGLKDPPRPFVLRPRGMEGRRAERGETLALDIHLFDLDPARPEQLTAAMAEWALDGLGPVWGGAELAKAEQVGLDGKAERTIFDGRKLLASGPALRLPLEQPEGGAPIREVTVEFLSPTELKGETGGREPLPFSVLAGRAIERVATLARLYSGEKPDVDFRGLTAKALEVSTDEARVKRVDRARVSARTGQGHGLGGTVGNALYRGEDLRMFVPWLLAAQWTGVGRQTVWGKGEVLIRWRTEGEERADGTGGTTGIIDARGDT